jgi:hypothetical protein
MISYDLRNADTNDYSKLIGAIELASKGVCCKPCESTYIIRSNFINSKSVLARLKKHIEHTDSLIIAKITEDVSSFIDTEDAKCLKTLLKSR